MHLRPETFIVNCSSLFMKRPVLAPVFSRHRTVFSLVLSPVGISNAGMGITPKPDEDAPTKLPVLVTWTRASPSRTSPPHFEHTANMNSPNYGWAGMKIKSSNSKRATRKHSSLRLSSLNSYRPHHYEQACKKIRGSILVARTIRHTLFANKGRLA